MVPKPPRSPSNEGNLALAVIIYSSTPLLLLGGDLAVIAASQSFCSEFAIAPESTATRKIFELGAGEWNVPQLRSLLDATASGGSPIDAYEMDLKGDGSKTRHLVLNARKLDYGSPSPVRILLAIADVTKARASEKLKDDLLREKAILLQEVQHRVANSLQIIASVLMVSARKVQSEETRGYLHDAHHRVMSIAEVQKQLAMSTLSVVELRAYFTKLCESLGASMIYDHKQLTLTVTADDSAVDANVSVSLGLIVTELVINALKHAFRRDHIGKILVDYRSEGENWTLSVTDNGVGMPADSKSVQPGLGTSIVEALANRLNAEVRVADAKPGTAVSIVHTEIAAASNANAEREIKAI